MGIDKEIKGQDLLSRLRELLHFAEVPSTELEFYNFVQKVCLLDLENVDNGSRHISHFKIDEDLISKMESSISSINNTEIKARFYDILQINRRDKFINCKEASELYFEIAKEGNLNSNREYYIRSLEVLGQIKTGAKAEITSQYENLKRMLLDEELGKSCYSINKIIQSSFNLSSDLGLDFNPFIEFINTGLLDLVSKNEYEKIRQCYGTLVMIDKENVENYKLKIAEYYEEEGDGIFADDANSQFLAVEAYKKALNNYTISNDRGKDDVSRVQLKLIEAQKKGVKQMVTIDAPLQHNIEVLTFIEQENFRSFEHAIYWFINIPFYKKSDFKDAFLKNKQSYYHLQYLNSVILDKEGNTQAKSEDNEKLIYQYAQKHRELITQNFIIHVAKKIDDQFSISYGRIVALISASTFIPQDRIDIYAYALYQGFNGNFAVSSHLLIPQIENSLRFVLQKKNIIPRNLTEEEQEVYSLSKILKEIKEIISEDLHFDLEGLLNNGFGANFRNKVSHGLCDTAELESLTSIYLWWLGIKLALTIEYYVKQDVEENNAQ